MSFNPRCPFHTAVATAAFLGAASYLYFRILKKSTSAIDRFDVDARFTNTVKYGEMVFISGQIGEGSTIEEQTRWRYVCQRYIPLRKQPEVPEPSKSGTPA